MGSISIAPHILLIHGSDFAGPNHGLARYNLAGPRREAGRLAANLVFGSLHLEALFLLARGRRLLLALCNIRSTFPPPIYPGYTAYDYDADLMQFRHPRYPDHNNILLVFPALDPTALPSTTTPHSFGPHHKTGAPGVCYRCQQPMGWIPFPRTSNPSPCR